MSEGDKKKVYGLIIPKKPGQDKKKAPIRGVFNVFGDDDDSDQEESQTKGPVGPYGATKTNSKLKLQSQMDIEKAVMEDPSVYEYDNIYDDIQATKAQAGKMEEAATKTRKSKKPQYMIGLLKAAEEKKKEQERRTERKVQKEREAEGGKFADKEAFVTSAYKQKMLERQKEEEEEIKKEQIEAMTDVTKQKDLGGFYRYLYRSTTGPEHSQDNIQVKQEPADDVDAVNPSQSKSLTGSTRRLPSGSDESGSDLEKRQPAKSKVSREKDKGRSDQRQFRKRRQDSSSSSSPSDNNDDDNGDDKNGLRNKERKRSGRYRGRDNLSSPEMEERKDGRPRRPEGRGGQDDPDRKGRKRQSSRSLTPNRKQKDGGRIGNSGGLDGDNSHRGGGKGTDGRGERGKAGGRRRKDDSPDINDNTETRTRQQTESERHTGNEYRHPRNDRDDDNDDYNDNDSNDDGEVKTQASQNLERPTPFKMKNKPVVSVDPRDKVYPHHNSPKDIEEARKRYLIRKIEREKARGS